MNRIFSIVLAFSVAATAACGTSGGTSGSGTATTDATAAASDAATADSGKPTDTAPAADAKPSDTTTAADTGNGSDTGAGTDATTGGDSSVASGNPIPIDQLEGAFADAMCVLAGKCGLFGMQFAANDSCKAFLKIMLKGDDGPGKMVALAKAGKIKYDPNAAGKCLAAMTASCGSFDAPKGPPECKLAFVGQAKAGDPCNSNEECASAFCKRDPQQSFACPGKCAAPVKAGEACDSSDGCEGALICAGNKCGAMGGKAGDPCSSKTCGQGLYCNQSGATEPVCAALAKIGDKCNQDGSCEAGAFCAQDTKTGEGKCTKFLVPGSDCDVQPMFGSGPSPDAGACGPGNQCLPKVGGQPGQGTCGTPVKLGGACTPGQCLGIDATCADIKDGKGVCKLLPGKGGACVMPDGSSGVLFTCLLPLVCDKATLKCVDPPVAGQDCMMLCGDGSDCNQGKCVAKGKAGQSCGQVSCESGLDCIDDKCAAPKCM